jgi:hypothetical protein
MSCVMAGRGEALLNELLRDEKINLIKSPTVFNLHQKLSPQPCHKPRLQAA